MHPRTLLRIAAATLVVASVGGLSAAARGQPAGNVVTDWNGIAATSIMATAAQPPHVAVLSLGMVQGAVYDAVNAIDGGREPYLVAPAADPSYSKEAAAATAAFRVLVGLFPAQQGTLEPLYEASLASVPDGAAKSGGIAVGAAAAAAMLTARTGDGRGGPFTVVEGFDPGEWRRTPPNFGGDGAAWVAIVRPFLVPNVEKIRSDPPNALTSAAYAEDFNEVKEIGSLTSTRRTADQTAAAIFWNDSGPAIWNRVFRALASSTELDVVDSARLYAMTNLAAADGSIGCWDSKYYWSHWRPITAIREAGSDGNPATEPDPAWLPFFNPTVPVSGPSLVTPGFPDHPAGHGCISGAFVHALKSFFGTDKVEFTAISNKCSPAPCPPRTFERFSHALKEVIDARVWSGIHFRAADVQGAVLGKKVVHYMEQHYFKPVD
ncbi:MAG TPA: vanadium-dependent haloperoxidase [Gaiellaceae bacterium]|nr:vanadium-dependent haloperoxidase [Gaiellaceae bacterium]